jgi:hypothetical protein
VSDDANVVVGTSGWQPPLDGIVWTPETKMVKVADYLTGKGVTGFQGWNLVAVNLVSPDGRIIGGVGINPSGQVEGWIATVK